MYKIYINETPLCLVDADHPKLQSVSPLTELTVRYQGKPRSLMKVIDLLEKTQRYESVWVYHTDADQLRDDFESLYKILEAGGGVVANRDGHILTMYRRDSWDLPKGKIDPGESREAAAIREVQEETGLKEVVLGDFLLQTDHTYKNKKGKRIIKRTYWYAMTTPELELTPETEEDIELCTWLPVPIFLKKQPIYRTILDVVHAYRTKKSV